MLLLFFITTRILIENILGFQTEQRIQMASRGTVKYLIWVIYLQGFRFS